jgi:hypothetical protein
MPMPKEETEGDQMVHRTNDGSFRYLQHRGNSRETGVASACALVEVIDNCGRYPPVVA